MSQKLPCKSLGCENIQQDLEPRNDSWIGVVEYNTRNGYRWVGACKWVCGLFHVGGHMLLVSWGRMYVCVCLFVH